jgi:hypothetical protein
MAQFKLQTVFGGNPNMSEAEAIEYAQVCLQRFSRGDLAAMHDIFYIVNVLGVFPDAFGADPEKIANNRYFRRLETLV